MDKDNNIIKPFGTLTPALRKAVDNIKQAILESQLRATKYATTQEMDIGEPMLLRPSASNYKRNFQV